MKTKFDVLPDWEFVGGETQEYTFTLRADNGGYYDVPGATASLAVAPFVNPTSTLFSKTASVTANEAGCNCLVVFRLNMEDTIDLHGKFIYQITIKTTQGMVASPQRGRMYITRNIDKAFIR